MVPKVPPAIAFPCAWRRMFDALLSGTWKFVLLRTLKASTRNSSRVLSRPRGKALCRSLRHSTIRGWEPP
jgi:hypothetical protein